VQTKTAGDADHTGDTSYIAVVDEARNFVSFEPSLDSAFGTMETLINIIDFGMNIQQAIEAPRWTTRSFPASPFPHTMYPGDLGLESRIPESIRQALAARGHKVRVTGPWTMGSIAVIMMDWETGVLSAAADPRVEAYAWAW
jgi:gamma-glutamyltranspeptidase / glutathione hydrolase